MSVSPRYIEVTKLFDRYGSETNDVKNSSNRKLRLKARFHFEDTRDSHSVNFIVPLGRYDLISSATIYGLYERSSNDQFHLVVIAGTRFCQHRVYQSSETVNL